MEEQKWTARIVDAEGKSTAAQEKELLDKKEQEDKQNEIHQEDQKQEHQQVEGQREVQEEIQEESKELELNDDLVSQYLGKRFEKEDFTMEYLEDALTPKEKEELPEDVQQFFKYKKETGRGLSDFMKIQRDFESESEDNLIREYIKAKHPSYSDQDASDYMKLELEYNEDIHDELDEKKIRLKRLEMKDDAVNFFKGQQEKYKAPLESKGSLISEEQKADYDQFLKWNEDRSKSDELNKYRSNDFYEKTNSFFSDKFDGFEFELEEGKTSKFEVSDVGSVRDRQMSGTNFVKSHLGDDGLLKNPENYHKSMFAADNIDKIVRWAYEQGRTSATEQIDESSKNIDMEQRKKPESSRSGGVSTRVIESSSNPWRRPGGGLKIKKK